MRGSLKSKRASGEEMPRVSARLQLEQASKMNVSQHLEPESLTNPSSLETLLAEEEEQDASELLSPSSCSFVLSSVADSPLPPPTRKVTALTESQHDYALRQPPQQRVVDGDTQDNQENEEPVRRLPRRILPQRVSAGELVVSYATEEELWSALRSSNSVVEEELPVEAEDESSLATTALLTPSRLRSSKTHQTEEEEQETTPVRAERRSSRRALAAQQQATHLGQGDLEIMTRASSFTYPSAYSRL